MYKKLNKDEIKLLRLLSDAYNFGNLADVSDEKYNDGVPWRGNYESIDYVNGLDANLVSQICNPISQVIASIIGQELHDYWINGSNYDVDWLIQITDSQETSKLSREEFENLMVAVAKQK
jgi:hypothetical protein